MMLVRFKEMAAVSKSSEVVNAMGDFFYDAFKYSSEEEKNTLRNVVLKNETLNRFPEFLKPNFRINGSSSRVLYDSLTALDVIKLGFWHLNKQKKSEHSVANSVVGLLYNCYGRVPKEFKFGDLLIPRSLKTSDFFCAYAEMLSGDRRVAHTQITYRMQIVTHMT